MSLDPRRYVDVVASGAPAPTSSADIEAASAAGAAAGAISGAIAGAEAGVEAGRKSGLDAGGEAGAASGASAGAQAAQPAIALAEASAQAAQTAQAAATVQAGLASTARAGAENARDQAAAFAAAIDTSTYYPDVTTGRAAVADGAYFKVIEADGVGVYLRVNSTTSPLQVRLPSTTFVQGKVNQVGCDAAAGPTYWTLTPRTGYAVTAVGLDQVFTFDAPEDLVRSLAVRITGINPDERTVNLWTGAPDSVAAGQIKVGTFCAIHYFPSGTRAGQMALVWPPIQPQRLETGAALTRMSTTSRTANTVTIAAARGVIPNPAGTGYLMTWQSTAAPTDGAAWAFTQPGVAPELPLVYAAGDAVPPGRIQSGDVVLMERIGDTLVMRDLWTQAAARGDTGGLSQGQLITLRASADLAARANVRLNG